MEVEFICFPLVSTYHDSPRYTSSHHVKHTSIEIVLEPIVLNCRNNLFNYLLCEAVFVKRTVAG